MHSGTALLIIDVQVGMFLEQAPVHDGDRLLTTLETLLAHAREAGLPVVHIQHNHRPGGLLINGTPNWEIHPRLAPRAGELVVQKHHPDAFLDTPLHEELTARGIRKLILSGIQTEVCVDTTTRRAYSLGYDVTLIQDAHSTWSNDALAAESIIAHHNQTLRWFADVVPAEQLAFSSTVN